METAKCRLKKLGKTQVWLMKKLRERGVYIQPPEMSAMLSGAITYPKVERVLKEVLQIIEQEEQEQANAQTRADRINGEMFVCYQKRH